MKRSGEVIRRAVTALVALATLVAAAVPAWGAPRQTNEGFRLLIGEDAVVPTGETAGTVIVADGDLDVTGDVGLIVVINGTVRVAHARVGDMVVINGQADLEQGAVVDGNVQLVQSVLLRHPDVTIGSLRNDTSFAFGAGLGALGILFGVGYSLALLIAATLFAAVMPRVAREAGLAMTGEVAKTALATLSLWILVPVVAVILFSTIVGIPFAVGLLIFLLPTLAFIGYLVAAVRLGDAILTRFRTRDPEDHPYAEALLGMVILVLASWIPGVGGVVTLLAFLGGSGALALVGWRAMRSHEEPAPHVPAGFGGVPSAN